MKGEAAEELRLPADALKRFRYLNRSGCTAIPGTDDVADFQLVQHAMDAVNIDKKAQACHLAPCAHSVRLLLTALPCCRGSRRNTRVHEGYAACHASGCDGV